MKHEYKQLRIPGKCQFENLVGLKGQQFSCAIPSRQLMEALFLSSPAYEVCVEGLRPQPRLTTGQAPVTSPFFLSVTDFSETAQFKWVNWNYKMIIWSYFFHNHNCVIKKLSHPFSSFNSLRYCVIWNLQPSYSQFFKSLSLEPGYWSAMFQFFSQT